MKRPTQIWTLSNRLGFALLAATIWEPHALLAQAAENPPAVQRGAQLVEVSTPFVYNADLRRQPRALEWRSGDPIREIPRRYYPRPGDVLGTDTPRSPQQGTDPLLTIQREGPAPRTLRTFSTPVRNFDGHRFSGVNPPDTVGDVGTLHYIQMVNTTNGAAFTIYNKSDGTVEAGPITLDSLGDGECANGQGDPIVLFDRQADRWLLSEFTKTGNRLCVYISKTADPVTGGWFNYVFQAPNFPDYPKYGAWHDAYYVTTNERTDPAIYALDRSQMLAGAPAGMLRFSVASLAGFGFQALTPGDLEGPNQPPAGAPSYFVRHRDDERHNPGSNIPTQDFVEIFEVRADFAIPANATLTGPFRIAIEEIDSGLCGFSSFECFPQPGPAPALDPLREVVMRRFQYRNFRTHETMVGNLVTDVDGTDRGGIRWYELRKTGDGAWTLFQQGTYSPDGHHRFMGSIAMDGGGNIALGYNVVSSTLFPGIRYTGRLASDARGTLPQGERSLIEGTAANASERYGDYSSLDVDPVDDCTFWLTGEYNRSGTWSTRIGAFSFAECRAQPSADTTTCQDQCRLNRDQCASGGEIPEATCGQIFDACQQICIGQPPP